VVSKDFVDFSKQRLRLGLPLLLDDTQQLLSDLNLVNLLTYFFWEVLMVEQLDEGMHYLIVYFSLFYLHYLLEHS